MKKVLLVSVSDRTSFVIVVVVFLLAMLICQQPLGALERYAVSAPGEVRRVSDVLYLRDQDRRDGNYYSVSIYTCCEDEMTIYWYLRGLCDPTVDMEVVDYADNSCYMCASDYPSDTTYQAAHNAAVHAARVLCCDYEDHNVANVAMDEIAWGGSGEVMYFCELYELFTGQNLNKGYKIAGTGALTDYGAVGGIGGVRQKVITADRAGMDYFLAPTEDYNTAVAAAKKVRVVGVDNIYDVIDFLESL